jgi:hypothetical protein
MLLGARSYDEGVAAHAGSRIDPFPLCEGESHNDIVGTREGWGSQQKQQSQSVSHLSTPQDQAAWRLGSRP